MVRARLAALGVALLAVACSAPDESIADGPPSPGSPEASATAMADEEDGQGSSAARALATGTPSPSPDVVMTRGQAEDLLGTWHDATTHVLRFHPDGSYDVDQGFTEGGTYEFDGDVLVMEPEKSSPCGTDDVARYEVRFSDDRESMQLLRVEDACAVRFGALRLGLEREG